jgi:hypothetical protein
MAYVHRRISNGRRPVAVKERCVSTFQPDRDAFSLKYEPNRTAGVAVAAIDG